MACEFKWNLAKALKAKCHKAFAEAYPDVRWVRVSRENCMEFATGRI